MEEKFSCFIGMEEVEEALLEKGAISCYELHDKDKSKVRKRRKKTVFKKKRYREITRQIKSITKETKTGKHSNMLREQSANYQILAYEGGGLDEEIY